MGQDARVVRVVALSRIADCSGVACAFFGHSVTESSVFRTSNGAIRDSEDQQTADGGGRGFLKVVRRCLECLPAIRLTSQSETPDDSCFRAKSSVSRKAHGIHIGPSLFENRIRTPSTWGIVTSSRLAFTNCRSRRQLDEKRPFRAGSPKPFLALSRNLKNSSINGGLRG